ncbi:CHAD domain-containing protein [Minwuia sp.]|uniref:CYTH and CHAD domain-containing protein n=1 Tax=Minwuia sp. TaxID=2493630 RepID=UPI003A8F9860
MAPSTETEIKLRGDVAVLTQAFAALGGDAQKTTEVVSVYHDTRDDRLWRKGYTLRLRATGGAHELTLKSEGAGLLVRGEWSVQLDEAVPDPGLLPPSAPRDELGLILPEELVERHRTVAKRTRKRVETDGSVIEVSLDLGSIEANGQAHALGEIEFELLHGDEAAILTLAERVLTNHTVAIEARSKAARGMELVTARPPAWHRAARPALVPADTIDGAIAHILSVTVAQAMANMAAAADGRDVSGVHQLRVALRRLRSGFSIFGEHLGEPVEGLNEQARRLLQALSPARDLDVFLNETLPPVLAEYPEGRGLDQLKQRAAQQRAAAYAQVRGICDDPEFSRFLVRVLLLARELEDHQRDDVSVRDFSIDVMKRHRKKALKKGRDFDTMPTVQRHEVRIAVKKLRYAVDFFRALYPPDDVKPFRRKLKTLQDDFGALNDAAVADVLADRIADGFVEALMGAALIKGWYAHRLKAIEPHMIVAWNDFRKTDPFWKR